MNPGDRYLELLNQIQKVCKRCGRDPASVQLIAVTKGHSWEESQSIAQAGCKDLGENRIPEMLEKKKLAPEDVQWHFIGALQRKKVNKVVGAYAFIHAVDSVVLAEKISSQSVSLGIKTNILLQANTSGEESKQGLSPDEWRDSFLYVASLPGLNVQGFMTMAPNTEDEDAIRNCFAKLRNLRDELQGEVLLPHLSMGMSNDFSIAIEEGATLLRIGSLLFL